MRKGVMHVIDDKKGVVGRKYYRSSVHRERINYFVPELQN